MSKISKIEVFKADIPFKFSFKHSTKKRNSSESIFIKILLDNGVAGYGESLPRSYVTGNTQDSVFNNLKNYLPVLIGKELKGHIEGVGFIKGLEGIEGEARCAVEIALLDCLGRVCNKPLHEILGGAINKTFVYSGIISGESLLKTAILALYFGSQGYKFIKIKVGSDNDISRVSILRNLLKDADIRIDANGAWNAQKALKAIKSLRAFSISCIEQPTPKGDLNAMQEVADFSPEPVMADESLCTKEDALRLAQTTACDMFNIRLSKCGGIFRSLEIARIAEDYGLSYQIGCHVGESGILSAAGRHLASIVKKSKYLEGSYSRLLLEKDIIEEDLTPKRSIGYTLDRAGLGITVKEGILRKYTQESILI